MGEEAGEAAEDPHRHRENILTHTHRHTTFLPSGDSPNHFTAEETERKKINLRLS